jgi:chemotaxis signal transduction protein
MRGLLFRMGVGLYALRLIHIREVLPMAQLRQVPGADEAVAGLLNLRGRSVPVVDLAWHCLGQGEPANLRTRIVVLPLGDGLRDAGGAAVQAAVGVVLQTTGDIVDLPDQSVQPCPVATGTLPFLAGLSQGAGEESVQWIDPVRLIASLAPVLRLKGAVHA